MDSLDVYADGCENNKLIIIAHLNVDFSNLIEPKKSKKFARHFGSV